MVKFYVVGFVVMMLWEKWCDGGGGEGSDECGSRLDGGCGLGGSLGVGRVKWEMCGSEFDMK